jgi:nitrate reductase NapAB chaperone NapD
VKGGKIMIVIRKDRKEMIYEDDNFIPYKEVEDADEVIRITNDYSKIIR